MCDKIDVYIILFGGTMKRVLVMLIALFMILNSTVILASAKNISFSGGELTESDDDVGDISSIFYDDKEKKININGTVAHGTMVSRNEDKLEVYRIPIGADAADVISDESKKPVISADISVKFHFSIKAEGAVDRFSAYVVVIRGKSGEWTTIGEPLYAAVDTPEIDADRDISAYKGISTTLTSNATAAGVGSAIVPVNFEQLLSHSSTGYLYSLQGTHIYFDKQYINDLDIKIKSYSAVGADVYLQFMFNEDGDSGVVALPTPAGVSSVPDMRSEQNLTLISAFTEFLCDRYVGISGIILGERVDEAYSESGDMSVREYAENYAQYMLTVANVARSFDANTDIVLPLGDRNSYTAKVQNDADELTGAQLLLDVSDFLDCSHVGRFAYSTMIETASIPYGISEATLKSKEFAFGSYDGINADTADIFGAYIDTLSADHRSTPISFIFKWIPNADTTGNVLACAYSYSYFKLMGISNINSFVVSFEDLEAAGNYATQDEISNIIKNIDTSLCFDVTAPQLKQLGVSNWYSIIKNMYSGKFDTRRIISAEMYDALPEEILGSYVYYDFMYHTDLALWSAGNFCDSLKIDHSKTSGRSLRAHFTPNLRTPTEYSEFFCDYDYPENYVFTPYVSIGFSIDEDEVNTAAKTEEAQVTPTPKKSLYEVKITMGSEFTVSELTTVCAAGEEQEVIFDMSDFSADAMVEYIKISVRSLGSADTAKGYTFSLATVLGHSTVYTAGELSGLIADERLRIRDMYDDTEADEVSEKSTWMIMMGAGLIIVVIGVGVFMCFRREDDTSTDSDNKD